MCFWIERPGCGHNDQDFCGQAKVTKILSTSIAEQQRDLGKIRLQGSEMIRICGESIQMKFQKL